jgi:hypothetical protein
MPAAELSLFHRTSLDAMKSALRPVKKKRPNQTKQIEQNIPTKSANAYGYLKKKRKKAG